MMFRKTHWLLVCALFPVMFAGCSQSENKAPAPNSGPTAESSAPPPDKVPPADVVIARVGQVELKAGGTAVALVTVKTANGYHINANPSSKYQIATALKVVASDGISAGEATYPPGISKVFSFSPDPIDVYEGDVVIKQPLKATSDAAKGGRSLSAKLKVQPCDDKVCYPPRDLDVSIQVNIK